MSKKKKKRKKNKNNQVNAPISPANLAAQAKLWMEAGDWAKARDNYKKLLQFDRDLYLPKLCDCYKQIVRLHLNLGNIPEAKQALFQIETLEGENKCLVEKIRLTLLERKYPLAQEICVQALQAKSSQDFNSNDYLIIFDTLILVSDENTDLSTLHPQFYHEMQIIHKALALLAQEQYQQALMVLREINFQSPVAHWRLLIKGLCAFYQGNDDHARKALSKISPDSLSHDTAKIYLTLLSQNHSFKQSYKKSKVLKKVCQVSGFEQLQDIVPRAEYLWHSNRKKDSYDYLRTKLKDFPTITPGIMQELSYFYFNCFFQWESALQDKYLNGIARILDRKGLKNIAEDYLMSQAEVLFNLHQYEPDSTLERNLLTYLDLYQKVFKPDPLAQAIIYTSLGSAFALVKKQPTSPWALLRQSKPKGKEAVINFDKALNYLEKAKAIQPDDINIYQVILKLYEDTSQKSLANRLLDDMVKRFPNYKSVFVKAAKQCMDRNALKKGVQYYEHAEKLDPLDRELREVICVSYIQLARRYVEYRNPRLFRSLLDQVLKRGSIDSKEFNLGHVYFYIRWAAFEYIAGSKGKAEELLCQAETIDNHKLVSGYFTLLIFKFYKVPKKWIAPIEKKVSNYFKGKAETEKALEFKYVLDYIALLPDQNLWLLKELTRFESYLNKLLKLACNPEHIRTLMLSYLDQNPDRNNSPEMNRIIPWITSMSSKMLKENGSIPFFQFSLWFAKNMIGFRFPSNNEVKNLNKILVAAQQRNDTILVNMIQTILNDIKHEREKFDRLPQPEEFPAILSDFLNDVDDDDYDDDDFDDDDDDDPFLGPFYDDGSFWDDAPSPIVKTRKNKKKAKKKQPKVNKNKKDNTSNLPSQETKAETIDAVQTSLFD